MNDDRPKLTLLPVQPLRTEDAHAFVDRAGDPYPVGTLEVVTWSVYPASAERQAFKELRIGREISMKRAGLALGLSVPDVSRLERGEVTLSADDWRAAMDVLRGMR